MRTAHHPGQIELFAFFDSLFPTDSPKSHLDSMVSEALENARVFRQISDATEDEDDDSEESDTWLRRIPYEPEGWGRVWFDSENGFPWTSEGIRVLQNKLYWSSVIAVGKSDEAEKWSALKWIFAPAIRKSFMWDKKRGKSICLETHENDYTFSFHLCAMAARMDEDLTRELIRKNIPDDLYQKVIQTVG
jgi:hypothetical protein